MSTLNSDTSSEELSFLKEQLSTLRMAIQYMPDEDELYAPNYDLKQTILLGKHRLKIENAISTVKEKIKLLKSEDT